MNTNRRLAWMWSQTGATALVVGALSWCASSAPAADPVVAAVRDAAAIVEGRVEFKITPDETTVPERFRLKDHTFEYVQKPRSSVDRDLAIYDVTFPSPVVTPHVENNTVHCEYFLPTKPFAVDASGAPIKRPGVIVLHILGGDFPLARAFCYQLASKGVAAMFLKMPYYGERRPAGSGMRMINEDPHQIVGGMTQAVLDIRRGAAFLASQPEIDPERLGVMGISLGGIMGALSCECEPRFKKAALLLAGGGVDKMPWNRKEVGRAITAWTKAGKSREELMEVLRPIDPVSYAANLKNRDVFMLNARQDEIIPPAATEALWKAAGEPRIEWWDAGHITAIRYLPSAIFKVGDFFADDWKKPGAGSESAEPSPGESK